MAYDTILGYLNGTLRYADSPSTIYVATIKGHPDFLKIGFCQLGFRRQRRSDPWIDQIIYESCLEQDDTIMCGDMTRREAFLIEQYLHDLLTHCRELIPELEEVKWSGRYETFRIPAGPLRQAFMEKLAALVSEMRRKGTDSERHMLDRLVSTAEEAELLEELKEQWDQQRAERMARVKALQR